MGRQSITNPYLAVKRQKKKDSEKSGVFLATKKLLWHNTCNRTGRIFRPCFGSAPARKDLRADIS